MNLSCLYDSGICVEKVTLIRETVEKVCKLSSKAAANHQFGLLCAVLKITLYSIVHFRPQTYGERKVFAHDAHDWNWGLFRRFLLYLGQGFNYKRSALFNLQMPHALTDIQKIILVILNASEYKKLIFLRGNLISRTSNSGLSIDFLASFHL